jgi:hypothetical protein
MQHLQHERRKSDLAANSCDKEHTKIDCVSASESESFDESSSKFARRAFECQNESRDFISRDTTCRTGEGKKCCSIVFVQCEITQDAFMSNLDLLKSSSFCNPFLKEGKGTESWRDFL